MITNDLNEQDKYLYGIFNEEGDLRDNLLHSTIEEAILFYRDDLITDNSGDISVGIYQKGGQIVPSEYSGINTVKIFELLKDSDKFLSEITKYSLNNAAMSSMFSKLSNNKITGIVNMLNDYLDKNIDTSGYYDAGEFIKRITLTKDEYIKYL